MADVKEDLKKKIGELKGQLAKQKDAGKDLKNDPNLRRIRKKLKRTQRKLARNTKLTPEEQNVQVDKLLELINKRSEELTKDSKKDLQTPYVRSMRKKLKSLNKRKKRLDRWAKKEAAKAEVAKKETAKADAAKSPPPAAESAESPKS